MIKQFTKKELMTLIETALNEGDIEGAKLSLALLQVWKRPETSKLVRITRKMLSKHHTFYKTSDDYLSNGYWMIHKDDCISSLSCMTSPKILEQSTSQIAPKCGTEYTFLNTKDHNNNIYREYSNGEKSFYFDMTYTEPLKMPDSVMIHEPTHTASWDRIVLMAVKLR